MLQALLGDPALPPTQMPHASASQAGSTAVVPCTQLLHALPAKQAMRRTGSPRPADSPPPIPTPSRTGA